MSVTIRPYGGGAGWEADIVSVGLTEPLIGSDQRLPVSSKTAALRWAEAREEQASFVKGKIPEG